MGRVRKNEKLVLRDYYNTLPVNRNPRKEFVDMVAEVCEVTPQAVRMWCRGIQFTPNMKKRERVMSLTGGKDIVEYYNSLPEKTSPRKEMVDKLVKVTGKHYQTVMWWVQGLHQPNDNATKALIAVALEDINPLDL